MPVALPTCVRMALHLFKKSFLGELDHMNHCRTAAYSVAISAFAGVLLFLTAANTPTFAQSAVSHDPAEPQQKVAKPKLLPRPAGALARAKVDEKSMRGLIEELVACGTRLTLSSWPDPKRGVGCGRDHIAARLNEIAKDSGG